MQTPDTIRQMGGHALTQLALDLGLAPAGAYRGPSTVWTARHEHWHPHEDVTQASVVFTAVRQDGWELSTYSRTRTEQDPYFTWGRCEALRSDMLRFSVFWSTAPTRGEDTEALALLRCAVLARVSTHAETPHG